MKYSLGSLIFLKRSLVFPILGGSWEELPYVQGKEQWLCFAGAAMNRDPTSKVRETQVSTESAYLSRHWERASEGRQTETTIRDNRSIWSHGPQPCLTHETKPCCVGAHIRLTGHGGEVWQNVVHWRSNGKPLQYSCLENSMNSMKGQKDRTLKDELPRSVSAQYATGDQWRNKSKKNEGTEPKQKQCPVIDVTSGGSKVWCYKQQYCIGTWNVRSMNQGKLEAVKQKITRVNIDILGIRELKWTGMDEFNSDDYYI